MLPPPRFEQDKVSEDLSEPHCNSNEIIFSVEAHASVGLFLHILINIK